MLLALPACSSSSTSTTPGVDASKDAKHVSSDATADAVAETSTGAPDVRPDVVIDPANCVAPGATSSELGIGGYCSPGGEQCLHAGSGGTATLCSADFGAPSHEWFCTITCNTNTDCGPAGGTCVMTPFSQVCVPTPCDKDLGDASTGYTDGAVDGGLDGGLDGTTDATSHDGAAPHDGAADAVVDSSHD